LPYLVESMSAAPSVAADVAALLLEATAADHRATERSDLIVRLMAGELDLAAYGRYLAQLAPVYEALEERPAGGWPIFEPGFARSSAIRSDLAALGQAGVHPALPEAHAHAARVRELVHAGDDVRYLAHHYARYLGDLSGGQAIGSLMARHYGATAEQLTFYDFTALGRPVEVKRRYRARMNALGLDAGQVAALIDEVRTAFRLTAAVFGALGSSEAEVDVAPAPAPAPAHP
jgi:heme oxygenase